MVLEPRVERSIIMLRADDALLVERLMELFIMLAPDGLRKHVPDALPQQVFFLLPESLRRLLVNERVAPRAVITDQMIVDARQHGLEPLLGVFLARDVRERPDPFADYAAF